MKALLEFDDAGAKDDEPVKGVTVGDIRAWHDRIEALEAALREIADAPAWGAPDRWETTPFEVRERARAALTPEQDK